MKFRCLLMAACLALGATAAMAQTADQYPNRLIEIVVGYPPGGSADYAARVVAERLQKELGQTVNVINQPGAGSSIAATAVMQATPDGYRLLWAPGAVLTLNPQLTTERYDPIKDFAPVAMIMRANTTMIVNPDLGVDTFEDFVELAKKRPGELNFSSSGNGTITHIYGEQLKILAGIDITHIPYTSVGSATTDLMKGRIHTLFDSNIAENVRAGNVKAVMVIGDQRRGDLPDVPSAADVGLNGLHNQSWHGILAPAKTPEEIVSKLSAALVKVVEDPETRARFEAGGMSPYPLGHEEFAKIIERDIQLNSDLIREANISAN